MGDAKGRRKIDLFGSRRSEVTKVDVFSRSDEVGACDSRVPRDDGWGTGSTLAERSSEGQATCREGCGASLDLGAVFRYSQLDMSIRRLARLGSGRVRVLARGRGYRWERGHGTRRITVPFGSFLSFNDRAGIPSGIDDCTVDGTSSPCILVVLRPVLFDCATCFTDILKIGTAKVLMLVNVKPKVEDVFCAFTLKEEAMKYEIPYSGCESRQT